LISAFGLLDRGTGSIYLSIQVLKLGIKNEIISFCSQKDRHVHPKEPEGEAIAILQIRLSERLPWRSSQEHHISWNIKPSYVETETNLLLAFEEKFIRVLSIFHRAPNFRNPVPNHRRPMGISKEELFHYVCEYGSK